MCAHVFVAGLPHAVHMATAHTHGYTAQSYTHICTYFYTKHNLDKKSHINTQKHTNPHIRKYTHAHTHTRTVHAPCTQHTHTAHTPYTQHTHTAHAPYTQHTHTAHTRALRVYNTKVTQLDAAAGSVVVFEENVVRLDVGVDDPLAFQQRLIGETRYTSCKACDHTSCIGSIYYVLLVLHSNRHAMYVTIRLALGLSTACEWSNRAKYGLRCESRFIFGCSSVSISIVTIYELKDYKCEDCRVRS